MAKFSRLRVPKEHVKFEGTDEEVEEQARKWVKDSDETVCSVNNCGKKMTFRDIRKFGEDEYRIRCKCEDEKHGKTQHFAFSFPKTKKAFGEALKAQTALDDEKNAAKKAKEDAKKQKEAEKKAKAEAKKADKKKEEKMELPEGVKPGSLEAFILQEICPNCKGPIETVRSGVPFWEDDEQTIPMIDEDTNEQRIGDELRCKDPECGWEALY